MSNTPAEQVTAYPAVTVHTVQNLGDHGREVAIALVVTGDVTLSELLAQAHTCAPDFQRGLRPPRDPGGPGMSDQTPEPEGARQLRGMVREAITNAYYDARNTGATMETAADTATESVMKITASVHENAVGYGKVLGALEVLDEIMLEREDSEEEFIVSLRTDYRGRLDTIEAASRG